MSHTHESLAYSAMSPLFVDRFIRSLSFCYLEFNKVAVSDALLLSTISVNDAKKGKWNKADSLLMW